MEGYQFDSGALSPFMQFKCRDCCVLLLSISPFSTLKCQDQFFQKILDTTGQRTLVWVLLKER